jgi:hypothetical protein
VFYLFLYEMNDTPFSVIRNQSAAVGHGRRASFFRLAFGKAEPGSLMPGLSRR